MEFLPSEIARLVLGYLEDEKCDTAYETFLTTSPNLTECLKMKEMGRKFRTQVIGLSLKEILHEYSTIYYSVHERLKKVDPEAADSLRNSGSLLDKLTFLLNANGSGQTMLFSITLPHGKSPTTSAVAHVRKKFKPSGLEKTKEKSKKMRAKSEGENICDELNISQINPCDVDATPLCSLPGNNTININQNEMVEEHEGISRTPKRKTTSIRKSRTNSSLSGAIEESLDFSVLTKVLIENHELHEKLAQNINKVICTPENTNQVNNFVTQPQPQMEPSQDEIMKPDSTAAYSASFNHELDHMIKKVVEQTESDPLFENIIFEALVPSTEETSDDCEERRMSNTSTPRKYTHNNEGSNSSDQDLNKAIISKNFRLKHTRSKSSSSETNEHIDDLTKNIEDHNAHAIKSIIAVNSKQKEMQENLDALVEATEIQLQTNVTTVTENLNTITKQTLTTVESNLSLMKKTENVTINQSVIPAVEQSNSNIVVISQPQPSIVSQPTYLLTTAHTSFPIQNQLLLIDNKTTPLTTQQFIIQQPQTNYQTLQLTERDIMAMPTVIMYGDERNYSNNNITTSCNTKYTKPTQPKLLPKEPVVDNSAPKLSITLYAGDEKSTNEAKMDIKPVGNNLQVTISPVKPGKSVPMILSETKIDEIPLQTPKIITPTTTTAQPRQSLSTPRSAKSHIRALDFSTPSKGSTGRKANTSPKGVKRSLIKKSPRRKDLRTSLFPNTSTPNQPSGSSSIPIATRVPTVKLCGDWDNVHGTGLILGQTDEQNTVREKPKRKIGNWDEDLRALCSVNDSAKTISPKKSKKKATPKRKAKKKSLDLNKTEDEVNKIEAALSSSLDNNKKKENNEKKDDNSVVINDKETDNKPAKETKKAKSKKDVPKRTTKKDTKDKESDTKKIKTENMNEVKIILEPLNVMDTKVNLRNMRPRLKKKCNITNPPISTLGTQNEPISCKIDQEDNPNSMTITFPTKTNIENEKLHVTDEKINVDEKFNTVEKFEVITDEKLNVITVDTANIITIEKSNIIEIQQLNPSGAMKQNVNEVEYPQIIIEKADVIEKIDMNTTQSKITPTNQRIINEQPITFKTNLTPILETPIKFDSLGHPITPKIFTPFSMTTDTPFSKLLNENIGSVDLSSIATPSFPLTPNFSMNITPGSQAGDEPYINRPTDYSTSSSYYQPSDTDQNQVIDQVLIEESKNMDKHKRNDKKIQSTELIENKILPNVEVDRKKFTADYILHEISLNSPAKTGTLDKTKYSVVSSECPVTEKNVDSVPFEEEDVGNITVVDSEQLNDSSSSSSSNSSYSSSSTDDSTDDTSNRSENTNNTVIHLPKEEVQSRYSLRTRKTPCKTDKKAVTPMKILKKKKVVKIDRTNNSKESINLCSNESDEGNIEEKEVSPKIQIKIEKDKKINDKSNQPSTSAVRVARPKSKVMVSPTFFETLEEKRLRVLNAMKNPNKKLVKKAPVSKTAPKKPITKKSTTNIKSGPKTKNTIEETDIQNEMETNDEHTDKIEVDKKLKSKSSRKCTSIESVAMRLKELSENKDLQTEPKSQENIEMKETKSEVKSIKEDEDTNAFKRKREASETDKEEEIPHLHLSSDEEEVISGNVNNLAIFNKHNILEETERKKLEELKERGIHLIPKNIVEETKENKKQKVKIQNVVVLDKNEKIDFSKVTDLIKTDVICKKDTKCEIQTKTQQIEKPDYSEEKKLDCSMESYQFSLEDDAPLPAEANFNQFVYSENSPCFFNFTYDESTICNRTLEDYDFADLSKKTISAQVFVSELDTLMTRKMSFSPYVELFSYSPYRKRITPIRIENLKRIQSNRQMKKEAEKTDDTKIKTDQSKNKLKSVDDSKKKDKVTKTVKTNEKKVTNKISLEQYKSKYREQIDRNDQEKIESTEAVEVFSDQPQDLSCKKRKLGSDVTDVSRSEKRNKADDQRALLKNIDLELFLTKVHGPSQK